LDVAHIVQKATVVLGTLGISKSLVHLKGRALERVECVPSDAALEAGTRFLAQDAQRFDLVEQVLGAMVQAGEAIDTLAVQTLAHEQLSVARIVSYLIGLGQRIERGAEDGMLGDIFHLLAEDVHLVLEPAQALDELWGFFHTHGDLAFLCRRRLQTPKSGSGEPSYGNVPLSSYSAVAPSAVFALEDEGWEPGNNRPATDWVVTSNLCRTENPGP